MANTLTNEQAREWAQILYTRERLSQKEIALKVGKAEKTISLWKDKYKWDALRQSLLVSKEEQIRRLYGIVDKLTRRIDEADLQGDTKEADKLIKYTAAINALETETSVAQIIEAARILINSVQSKDPVLALRIAEEFDLVIKERLKRF